MVTVWFLRSIDVKEYSPVKTDWVGRESIEQNWASGFRLVGRCLGASGRDELECGVLRPPLMDAECVLSVADLGLFKGLRKAFHGV